jgi:hypothetical protein
VNRRLIAYGIIQLLTCAVLLSDLIVISAAAAAAPAASFSKAETLDELYEKSRKKAAS